MEQLFWRSNGNREKARFLRRWEIFSHSRTSASAGRRIKLPFGSDRILFGSQIGQPRSLAKISNASQKSNLFLGVREGLLFAKISNVIANRTFPMECEGTRSLAKISNASQKSSLFLTLLSQGMQDLESSRKGGSGRPQGSPLCVVGYLSYFLSLEGRG